MPNLENKVVSIQRFYGGQSSDEAIGTEASFSYSRALDHRSNPSQLSVLPAPRKISASVITDLILNIVQVNSGVRYAMGDQGYVYKIDTSNVVTSLGKLPTGSDGMVYRSDTDAVYLTTQTDVRRLFPISGSPTFDVTLGPSKSIDSAAYRTGGVNIFTVPTTLDETKLTTFLSDIEPFYSIKVNVVTKGSGNLTLTLHDGVGTVLATQTILNANITLGLNEFVFTTPVRGLVKPNARTYHFHITSSATGTTLAAATTENADTLDFELWATRLIQQSNGFHATAQFQQFILFGNDNYLAVWEPLTDVSPPNNEFQRHRLTFPAGYSVCGIAVTDEFAVIACEKRATDATKDFQEGKLFIWDGVAQTYNQVVDVSGGSPEGIRSHENYPYFVVNGTLCCWPGGKNIIKVRKIAAGNSVYSGVIDNTHIYPNMLTIRDNLLHVGYPSTTTSTSVEHGVYVWGSAEKNYAASFNYGYITSTMQTDTHNTDGTRKLGMIQNFGDEMYISWKDGTGYGLDIVDNLCTPAPVAKFRARRFDAGAVRKTKQAIGTGIETAPLPAGVTITPTYRIDADAEVSQTEGQLTTGKESQETLIQRGAFKRIVYGFDIAITGTSSPVIYADSLEWNPLGSRKPLV